MTKLIKLITLFSCFFVFYYTYSQDKSIDSLKMVLKNPKLHDTTRLSAIANSIDRYIEKKQFVELNNILGRIASKNLNQKNTAELSKKYTMYLAAYYNNLGVIYDKKRDFFKALESFDKSILLFKSKKVFNEMSYAIIGKGVIYTRINEYEKAISCYFEALNYFEKFDQTNLDGISYCYSSIGILYSNLEDYQKAIQYYKKAMVYFEEKKDAEILEDNIVRSELHVNCGSAYFNLKNYQKSLNCFSQALIYSKNNKSTTSIILSKIARIKIEQLKFEDAEKSLKEALKLSDNDLTESNTYIRFGELYYKKKDFKKADIYLSKGLDLAIKIKSSTLQEQASELLYKVNKEDQNFKKALIAYTFLDKLQDSINLDQSKNTLERQELKYSYEKKEFYNKLENQKKNAVKNNWLIALSAVLLLLLLGSYFYYRNNKQKHAISIFEKEQIKQKLLISQMNPHFIFNSIDNIQSLIYNKQENEAVNYLTKFSKLTRQILENSNENYISLTEELTMIENYLVIQQLLYSNKFDFRITIEDTIDTETILLPPMLTQPFIENAIKHGLANKSENGKIEIAFYLKDDKLLFEVADNGSGFDGSKKVENHKSLAMSITNERLVNYTKNQNFTVVTDNIIDGNKNVIGAKVVFEIPYIYEK